MFKNTFAIVELDHTFLNFNSVSSVAILVRKRISKEIDLLLGDWVDYLM